MALTLSRVDCVEHTIDPAKLAATGLTITGVTVALLPVRSAPTSGTVWSALTSYAAPTTAKVMLAGPDASSVGALVVTADCDLWALVTDGSQTEAVKIERINLEGSSGTITPLPSTYVTSVNGKSGVATLTFSDVGADAAGAAATAQAAAVAAIPSMSTIAADPALRAAYVASVSVTAYGAKGDGTTDDSAAFQAALNALTPLVGTVFERSLFVPQGTYIINTPLTTNGTVCIFGIDKLGTRLRVGPSFPAGGTLLSFIKDSSSPVTLEGKIPHLTLRGLTLDGNARSVQASALHLDFFDRAIIDDVYIDSFAGSAITARCLRESRVTIRTWLCGDSTHPVIDLDETGSTISEGGNLNTFHGCVFVLNMGDQLRIRAPYGVVSRINEFVQCVFHGLNEWIEDYADEFGNFGLGTEGNVSARIVIDHARNVFFSNCRFHLNGRGQPLFFLSNFSAGVNTLNSVTIANSVMSYRGNAYSSRTLATADATTDQFTLAGVNLPGRHQLQTGSRIQFASTTTGIPPSPVSLPGGITAGLDYYAIKVDDYIFQVATSRANALSGTAVDVTSTGGGVITQFDTAVTVDTGLDTLTAPDHRLTTGARFQVGGSTLPSPLVAATDYFVIRVDKNTVKLATTAANAAAGTAIDLTTAGSAVFLSPQDFVAHIDSGTLNWGTGNTVEGPAPVRGYFRVTDNGTPAGVLLMGSGSNWLAGATAPPVEYASGALPFTKFDGGITLTRNAQAIQMARSDGTTVQVARYTAGNAAQFGTLTGSDNAQFVAAGLGTLLGGGSERFRFSSAGISFFGKTSVAGQAANPGTATGTDATVINNLVTMMRNLGFCV